MKKALVITPLIVACTGAHATIHHAHTNAITAHNIGIIQHNITQNAIKSFNLQNTHAFKQNKHENYSSLYGTNQTYGEYNEDGTIGHNGGDNHSKELANTWLDWQHTGDKVKYDNIKPIKTDTDIIMAGLASAKSKNHPTQYNWGTYIGYINSNQSVDSIEIKNQGGFFGIYNGLFVNNFTLKTTMNAGALDTYTSTDIINDDNITNFWIGAATNASYDIILDSTFILRPVLHIGYTWFQSKDYISKSGEHITNQNFNLFEITPEIQAIKHIGNGWFGQASFKYSTNLSNHANTYINETKLTNLSDLRFTEYSISIGKNIANTNLSATIGRHDGDIYGWFGGANIKYLF